MVTCEVINWKKEEFGFQSKQFFERAHPNVKFCQHEGSFIMTNSKDYIWEFFRHRAAESLDLPPSVICKILAYLPSKKGIRQLQSGDFPLWRTWVLEGCTGELAVRNTKFGHLYIAVDFADCLR
jgi:hypothetical protein